MEHGRLTVRLVAPLIKKGRSCFGGTSPGMQVRVPVRLSPPGFANRELADKNLFEKFPDPEVTIKNNCKIGCDNFKKFPDPEVTIKNNSHIRT